MACETMDARRGWAANDKALTAMKSAAPREAPTLFPTPLFCGEYCTHLTMRNFAVFAAPARRPHLRSSPPSVPIGIRPRPVSPTPVNRLAHDARSAWTANDKVFADRHLRARRLGAVP
jgi:hypothetical protein